MNPWRSSSGRWVVLLSLGSTLAAAAACSGGEQGSAPGRTGGQAGDAGGQAGERTVPSGGMSGAPEMSGAGADAEPDEPGGMPGVGGAVGEAGRGGEVGGGGATDEHTCSPDAKRCSGNGVQVCTGEGEWAAVQPCATATPWCSGAGVCSVPPSCKGLQDTCGAGGGPSPKQTCCASAALPAGDYDRSNIDTFPTSVSGFRLDTFEITIGRFANFVAAYKQNMIVGGAGRNPTLAGDTGWNSAWNAQLPATTAALEKQLQCDATHQTWGTSLAEVPINCLTWYVAEAFCIWDGGFLPTEAQWNYAAAGGSEQRLYPWGPTDPNQASYNAAYGCVFNGSGTCSGLINISMVGFNHNGMSRWGQFDLAGNMQEWTFDSFVDPYAPTSCNDCTVTDANKPKSQRGGNFKDPISALLTSYRDSAAATAASSGTGARCARAL